MSRLGTQRAAELASALFSDSNAYVPYGRGSYTASPEVDMVQQVAAIGTAATWIAVVWEM